MVKLDMRRLSHASNLIAMASGAAARRVRRMR